MTLITRLIRRDVDQLSSYDVLDRGAVFFPNQASIFTQDLPFSYSARANKKNFIVPDCATLQLHLS